MSTNNTDTKINYEGKSYQADYELFLSALEEQGGLMSASEVGHMIVRMSSYFTRYNIVLQRSLKLFNQRAQEIYNTIEPSGKPISAAKAEIVASATEEAVAYQEAKTHVQNIEQDINALKALQRGVLNEYSHSAT